MPRLLTGLSIVACLLAARPGPARAAGTDDLIALVQSQPAGMADDVWRDKRRGAARELGLSGDRRAVPALIAVAEGERLDEVGEIAIEALGRLGDPRAVEPLLRIHRDGGRSHFARGAAARALRDLGVDPETGAGAPPAAVTEAARVHLPEAAAAEAPAGPRVDPDKEAALPEGPTFAPDVIAASERWTFAVGSFQAHYDSVQERADVTGDLASRYRRGLELPGFGYSLDAGAAVSGGLLDRDTTTSGTGSSNLVGSASGSGEARFYPSSPRGFFGHLGATVGLNATAYKAEDPAAPTAKDFAPSGNVGLVIGPGWGRIVDVGVRLRLKRIEDALREGNALARPVDADLARRIQSAWWALRGEIGVRRRLLVTIRLLREAGAVTQDPDPGTTYRLLRVLEDGQLAERLDGFDARIGVGETFLFADKMPMGDDVSKSRQETALFRARFARQLAGGLSEIVSEADGVYRLTGSPGFYLATASGTLRRYFYSYGWDPRGAVELGAHVGVSDSNTSEPAGAPKVGRGSSLGATLGYLFMLNRASSVRVAADATMQDKDLFLGLRLDGTWGLLDATAASW